MPNPWLHSVNFAVQHMIKSLILHQTAEMLPLVLVILIQSQPLNGMPVTQKPQTTYPFTPHDGCFWDGKWYERNSDISRGSDGHAWCYGIFCNHDGYLTIWDDWNCATTSPPSTTPPKTIEPSFPEPHYGCFVDGKWYERDSEVSRGSDGNGWCFGEYCTHDGHLIAWDDWNCATTSPPSTTRPYTPEGIQTTTPLGCVSNGVWYATGSEVSRGSDEKGNEWGTFCDDNGQLIAWDTWNRKKSTTADTPTTPSPITTEQSTAAFSTTRPTPLSPTTHSPPSLATTTSLPPTTTTPPPPTTHVGCFQDGKWYPAGSEINKGSDGKGWCYGSYCTADGQMVYWDNFNCDPTTTKPTSPSTTAAPTTSPAPSPTTVPIPLGCLQNGAWYEPGSEISRESDGEGWCHGIFCDANGNIVAWDEWNCEATDDPPSEETQADEP